MLNGYGALRRRPPRLLLRNLLQLMRTRWRHLGPRGATNVLVALARVRMPPHAGWVKGLLQQALVVGPAAGSSKPERAGRQGGGEGGGQSDLLTFEGAARCLWALGTLCVDPGPDIMAVLVGKVEAAIPAVEEHAALLEEGEEEEGVLPPGEDEEEDPERAYWLWRSRVLGQARWGCEALGYRRPGGQQLDLDRDQGEGLD